MAWVVLVIAGLFESLLGDRLEVYGRFHPLVAHHWHRAGDDHQSVVCWALP